jgi:hypothetical protein
LETNVIKTTFKKIKLNQSSNLKRWKRLPSENNLNILRISVGYPCMLSKTCLIYFRCIKLPLQLVNYEQQWSFSENEKQWVSVSSVCMCKAASAHAHPRVNDPWVIDSWFLGGESNKPTLENEDHYRYRRLPSFSHNCNLTKVVAAIPVSLNFSA